MSEEYLKTLEDKINQKIAEKLALEQELESLQILVISKGAENAQLNSINNELQAKKQELDTAIIVSLNTQSQYMAKIKDLKNELENYHTSIKEYDLLKIKLAEIGKSIEVETGKLEALNKEVGSLDLEVRNMRDEWGKLKRENDKLAGIEAKLATAEMSEKNINNKLKELEVKKSELALQLLEIEKQKKEYVSNPLSIGYYIKFLQKRLDEGKLKDVFDEIKRAS
jgi:chromosome segregation ATPase